MKHKDVKRCYRSIPHNVDVTDEVMRRMLRKEFFRLRVNNLSAASVLA
jgi:hypothetical protein